MINKQLKELKNDYKNGFPVNIDWLIQQAEIAERYRESLEELESLGLGAINYGYAIDANELVDIARQYLEVEDVDE